MTALNNTQMKPCLLINKQAEGKSAMLQLRNNVSNRFSLNILVNSLYDNCMYCLVWFVWNDYYSYSHMKLCVKALYLGLSKLHTLGTICTFLIFCFFWPHISLSKCHSSIIWWNDRFQFFSNYGVCLNFSMQALIHLKIQSTTDE